jgi:23S rRNA maturation-related 3'-5' exoribonuclease YhaM
LLLNDKLKVFEYELKQIKNENIKLFTFKMLEVVPSYFYEVAASSTGKYHPAYALGEGGLIRHTKAAVRIAKELLTLEMFKYNDNEKDAIISALILHDACKHGINKSKYTITEHPLEIVKLIKQHKEICQLIDEKLLNIIIDCISTHMGQWTKDYKTKREVLPKPKTGKQHFVHMCDYLASRKCIELNFEV